MKYLLLISLLLAGCSVLDHPVGPVTTDDEGRTYRNTVLLVIFSPREASCTGSCLEKIQQSPHKYIQSNKEGLSVR